MFCAIKTLHAILLILNTFQGYFLFQEQPPKSEAPAQSSLRAVWGSFHTDAHTGSYLVLGPRVVVPKVVTDYQFS